MPRRLLTTAAAGALLLGLAACGDPNDGPVTTPPPDLGIEAPSDGGGDPAPSDGGGEETGTSTVAAPDIPPPDPADYAGMDENTEDGATQAFRYYIAVSMWAHQTGDDIELMTLQTTSCEGCSEFNSDIPAMNDLGVYWDNFDITDVRTNPLQSENYEYEIGYLFSLPSHSRPDLETGELNEYNPVEYIAIGGMSWTNSEWTVGGLKVEWGSNVHSKY